MHYSKLNTYKVVIPNCIRPYAPQLSKHIQSSYTKLHTSVCATETQKPKQIKIKKVTNASVDQQEGEILRL